MTNHQEATVRERLGDWIAWGAYRARLNVRTAGEDVWVLAAAGTLMVAVGTLGYVFGDVPPGVERSLPPLQLITDRVFGWLLAASGTLTVALAPQVRTLRVGYGVAVGTFAVMGVWFLLGWLADPILDTRPLASTALYAFVTGILLIHARSARQAARQAAQ